MWSPHQRGCALSQSADGPVLRTTQRVGDHRQSQTMFIGRLLCGARISEHQSPDAVGLLDADTNKPCSYLSARHSRWGHSRLGLLTRVLEDGAAVGSAAASLLLGRATHDERLATLIVVLSQDHPTTLLARLNGGAFFRTDGCDSDPSGRLIG